jgi:hypothetical protein
MSSEMSKLNKYVQTDAVKDGDFQVAAQSLKHMNVALMERIKEGVNLIAQLKEALVAAQTENAELKEKLSKSFPLPKDGKEESIEESSGNPEEGSREVSVVPQAEEEEVAIEFYGEGNA